MLLSPSTFFKKLLRNGFGNSIPNSLVYDANELTVSKSDFLLLINSIKKCKDLSSYKGVISINNYHNFTWVTIIMTYVVHIFAIALSFVVLNNDVELRRNLILYHVIFNLLSGFIFWGIIHVDHMIITVLLLKNRIKISQIMAPFSIIERRYIHTKSNLVMNVLINLVFLVVVLLLLW